VALLIKIYHNSRARSNERGAGFGRANNEDNWNVRGRPGDAGVRINVQLPLTAFIARNAPDEFPHATPVSG
jgi:hypothetical protein